MAKMNVTEKDFEAFLQATESLMAMSGTLDEGFDEEAYAINKQFKSFKLTPKRIQNAMYHLRQKYGYFYETVDKTVLYYDSQTRRVKNENYYTEKYGISFIQADE